MQIVCSTSTSALQLIANGVIVITSISALVIAIWTHRRNLELQRQIADENLKPVLAVTTSSDMNNKEIILHNVGLGTAEIIDVEFTKDEKSSKDLLELLDLAALNTDHFKDIKAQIRWDHYWPIDSVKGFLKGGESRWILQLTKKTTENFFDNPDRGIIKGLDYTNLAKEVQTQLSGIMIKINYQDILRKNHTYLGRRIEMDQTVDL